MNLAEFDTISIYVIGGVFCLLLVGAMLAFLRQALRGPTRDGHYANQHAEVDNLMQDRTALDADYQSGRINQIDYAATCFDIDQRLLKLIQKPTYTNGIGHGKSGLKNLGIGLAVALPVSAALIYAYLGRPDLADKPFVNRAAEIASQSQTITTAQQDLAQNLKNATSASIATPDKVESWLNLAEAAAAVNDSATEIRALRIARQLTNDDPVILSLLAEALSRAADGQVTVPARALIGRALAANPTDPRALFLWGLSAFQDGDYSNAITRWQNLLSISTPNAPWLPIVRRNIQQAAEAGDIKIEARPGPDADTIAAAADMAPEDREEMILTMVKALRNRLTTTPDDTDGWLRLARAYDVLGDADAAFHALAQATVSKPENHSLSYQFLERTIGLEMSVEQLTMAQGVIDRLEDDGAEGPQFLFFTGHLAKLSGKHAKARTVWTTLLETMPSDSDMATALAAEIAKLNLQ